MPKRILVDARTPVHYTMFAPVHARMASDDRIAFSFIASDEPEKARAIFRDAGPDASIVSPARAALTKFDAYVTSDFTWTRLLHKTCRIQMFHGVGGKYGFDAPTESLRAWHRLFFVNERRLRNCVAAEAIDADSPAIRLIGMPKVDALADGSLDRDTVLGAMGLRADHQTVLYAPTWSPASSLNAMGVELVARLGARPFNIIVKLHDRSLDPRPQYSGGIDWRTELRPSMRAGAVVFADGADICPYLAAADVMITDHSSAGFEYLLRDRPIVRIHRPALITLANVHHDYVELLASVSHSTQGVTDTVAAVERAIASPHERSATRRAVAADLFYKPGTATERCVSALYEAIDLEQRSLSSVAQAFRPAPVAALKACATAVGRTGAMSCRS
jgi:CDP-glycerol glycerophosphotransferase (TagB/SpsB family)